MPIPVIQPQSGGAGNLYSESTHVIVKAPIADTDVYTPADPGPHRYNEMGGAIAKAIPAGTDVADMPAATFTEAGGVVVVVNVSAPNLYPSNYSESNGATFVMGPSGYDSQASSWKNGATARAAPGGTDGGSIAGSGNFWFEHGGAFALGVIADSDILAGVEHSGPVAKAKPGGSDIAAFIRTNGATFKGKPANRDNIGWAESGGPIFRALPGNGGALHIFSERSGAIFKAVPAGTDLLRVVQTTNVRIKGRPGSSDLLGVVQTTAVIAKIKAKSTDVFGVVQTTAAVAKAIPAVKDRQTYLDRSGAIAKILPANTGAGRVLLEKGGAIAKIRTA